jgi:4-hydroxy-2-oxoheptanedioate aldolase
MGESFKARLQAGQAADGCFLEMFNPIAAEIVAQAGFDSILIDLEHGPGSVLDAIGLIHAAQGSGCAVLLRVEENRPVPIKRALDIGLSGLMVPAVSSRAEAEACVAACRYAPRGNRGMAAPVVRATGHGAHWQGYVAGGADGVDLLFVGPFDLSASLGYLGEPDHPVVREAIDGVEKAAKAAGKLLGAIPTPGRTPEELFAAGYDLVVGGPDNGLLREAAQAEAARLKAAR